MHELYLISLSITQYFRLRDPPPNENWYETVGHRYSDVLGFLALYFKLYSNILTNVCGQLENYIFKPQHMTQALPDWILPTPKDPSPIKNGNFQYSHCISECIAKKSLLPPFLWHCYYYNFPFLWFGSLELNYSTYSKPPAEQQLSFWWSRRRRRRKPKPWFGLVWPRYVQHKIYSALPLTLSHSLHGLL